MADIKWIKITTDIFDNRKIKQIESLPEGYAIIVIWLKLLCLAGNINDSGFIYLTSEIPYTEQALSTQFSMPISIIHLALKTFEQFGMIETVNDFMHISNWERYQNLEGMEKIREQNRIRKQNQRNREKILLEDSHVTSRDSHATDKNRKEKNREDKNREEKEKEKEILSFYPNDAKLNQAFADFVEMRKKIKKPLTDRAVTLQINKLNSLAGNNNDLAIKILEQSTMNCWQSLYPLKENNSGAKDSILERWNV